MAAKTVCPITRKQFDENAKPIKVVINGEEMQALNRQFSTGSMGWNISSKMKIKVGDTEVTVQVGLNLTIVGSKDLPGAPEVPKKGAAAAASTSDAVAPAQE